MRTSGFIICIYTWALCSCTETLPPQPELVGFNYFPLEVGDFRSYDVEKIEYSLFFPTDTSRYQLKQVVVDTFLTQNEVNFVLHRFTRGTSSDNWSLDSVWTSRRTQNHAIVVENNVPFVKIVFPIDINKKWNGNLFNTSPVDEYEITEIGGSIDTPAGTFFDNLTIFENNDPDTLIFQDIRTSIYAQNVGLVYKYYSILDFCNTDPDCLGNLEFGTKFEQILIEYGKE